MKAANAILFSNVCFVAEQGNAGMVGDYVRHELLKMSCQLALLIEIDRGDESATAYGVLSLYLAKMERACWENWTWVDVRSGAFSSRFNVVVSFLPPAKVAIHSSNLISPRCWKEHYRLKMLAERRLLPRKLSLVDYPISFNWSGARSISALHATYQTIRYVVVQATRCDPHVFLPAVRSAY